jgi:hypothetical protein
MHDLNDALDLLKIGCILAIALTLPVPKDYKQPTIDQDFVGMQTLPNPKVDLQTEPIPNEYGRTQFDDVIDI